MIAEPYICIKGPKAGTIEWMSSAGRPCTNKCDDPCVHCGWESYADFEREKLKEIETDLFNQSVKTAYYWLGGRSHSWFADELIGYTREEYEADSESSRLLKRAEFLKAVCEKEGVEWLSRECTCNPTITFNGRSVCPGHLSGKATLWIGETTDTLVEVPVRSIKIEFGDPLN